MVLLDLDQSLELKPKGGRINKKKQDKASKRIFLMNAFKKDYISGLAKLAFKCANEEEWGRVDKNIYSRKFIHTVDDCDSITGARNEKRTQLRGNVHHSVPFEAVIRARFNGPGQPMTIRGGPIRTQSKKRGRPRTRT